MTRLALAAALVASIVAQPVLAGDPPQETPFAHLARAWNVCLWRAAFRLDDHTSPADVIAEGVGSECVAEYDALDDKRGCETMRPDDPGNAARCERMIDGSDRTHRIDMVLKERAWRAARRPTTAGHALSTVRPAGRTVRSH
jgi:hypothetical protein